MEDLRVTRKKDDRLTNISDKAEYEHLLRRFHVEEEKKNMKHLLFGSERLSPADRDGKD